MRILPVGHRVLVRIEKVEETTKGGIVLPGKLVESEALAQQFGTVEAIGRTCWTDLGNKQVKKYQDNCVVEEKVSDAWCNVGDKVLFQRHAGMRIPDNDGGFLEDLILLNDIDITAICVEESDSDE